MVLVETVKSKAKVSGNIREWKEFLSNIFILCNGDFEKT